MLGVAASFFSGCLRPDTDVIRLQFAAWGSVEEARQWTDQIERFEAANPGIEVEFIRIGTRYAEKVQSMMVGNIAPDVMTVEMAQYYQWAARGVLLDVTDDVTALDNESPIMPAPLEAFNYGGRYYALPFDTPGFVSYVNLDALDRAGVTLPPDGPTWQWLLQVAPRLSRKGGDPDAPTDYVYVLPPTVQALLYSFGADLFDDPHHPNRPDVDTPEMRSVLQYLRTADKSGCVVPLSLINASDNTLVTSRNQLFIDQRVAFFFSGYWQVVYFPKNMGFRWDVRPIPAGPAGRTTQHGGTGLGVSSTTRHPAAARAFARFCASPENRRRMMEWDARRVSPVYRELAYDPDYLNGDPGVTRRYFSDTMEAGASRFIVYAPGADHVNTILNDTVERLLSNPGVPVDAIIDRFESDLNRFLQVQRRKGML